MRDPEPADPNPDAPGERARQLLLSWLSPAQAKQYARSGGYSFEAVGSGSGDRYTIKKEPIFNVERYSQSPASEPIREEYCAVLSRFNCPSDLLADRMLAQKIMIETDEEAFLKVANGRSITAGELTGITVHDEPQPNVV